MKVSCMDVFTDCTQRLEINMQVELGAGHESLRPTITVTLLGEEFLSRG